ncbi:MAG TPA: glycoside hydrolase [bacterium]|nr:glycoside hydrolase [bacterium]
MGEARATVDFGRSAGALRPIWRSIGYDEINWTYTPRGHALYDTLEQVFGGPLAVRNHNALTSGNGLSGPAWGSTNLYHERQDGSMALDWRWADQIYDVFAEHGCEPIIELGFMPRDLSAQPSAAVGFRQGHDVGHEPYEGGAWKHPPKSVDRWRELCQAFAAHLVERYGAARVRRWRFEVWNEPDIPNYWRGSLEQYCALYEGARAGVKAALPDAQVGGPATTGAGTEFLGQVLARIGRPDFASFHTKGAHYAPRRHYNPFLETPKDGPSLGRMLDDVRRNVAVIRDRFPDVPILVDECDPAVGTVYGVFDNPNFIVCNTTHYPTMLCALADELLRLGEVELFTTWAFYFEGKRWFEGNRTLVTNENVELPVLDGFRMLERLGTRRVDAHADGVGVLAGDRAAIVYRHADAWWEEGSVPVALRCEHAGRAMRFSRFGNSHARWLEQGSPQRPSPAQVEELRAASGLKAVETVPTDGGRLAHRLEVPLHEAVLCEVVP